VGTSIWRPRANRVKRAQIGTKWGARWECPLISFANYTIIHNFTYQQNLPVSLRVIPILRFFRPGHPIYDLVKRILEIPETYFAKNFETILCRFSSEVFLSDRNVANEPGKRFR